MPSRHPLTSTIAGSGAHRLRGRCGISSLERKPGRSQAHMVQHETGPGRIVDVDFVRAALGAFLTLCT